MPEKGSEGAARAVRLERHPRSGAGPLSGIDIQVSRADGVLILYYKANGDIARVRLPGVQPPARSDDLWQHTCFEAFLRQENSDDYWEFNFAPSLRWAAYHFDANREGMRVESGISELRIEVQTDAAVFALSAVLDLSGVAAMRVRDVWRLGLSAVIEDVAGAKSFWALAHPAGKPDFHHPDSFVLELSPKGQIWR